MRDAAVGFQCPECIKEGARTTRAGRLPYGGQQTRNPHLVTYVLIAVNAVVWLLISATGGAASTLVDKLALLPASAYRRMPDGTVTLVQGVDGGAWWQLMTSVFTHVEPLHIGFNMLALFFLGPAVESVLGRGRFLALYLVSGLCGSAAVMLFADPHSQTLGASGAIFGLMGALVVLAFKVGGNLQSVLMWLGLNLVFTFTAGGISWQGHVGGLVGGLVLGTAIAYAPRTQRSLVQWGSVGAVTVAAVVLVALRVSVLG